VQHAGQAQQWAWRTNLAASSPYWQGWYEGLSDAFLALRVPKMLLLAGTDRWVGRQLLAGRCWVLLSGAALL
jgi:hypothetical protein